MPVQTPQMESPNRIPAQPSPEPTEPERKPLRSFGEMWFELVNPQTRSRTARSVEIFGWLDLLLGTIILWAPSFVQKALHLPELTPQGEHFLRLVGLLVGGLGMLYVVSGRLNAEGFLFASLLDRPLVPFVMAVLWYKGIVPGALALAFSATDFGGFLWTFFSWRAEAGPHKPGRGLIAGLAARFFGFTSGVIRNARTFHPDGRTLFCTVRSLQPSDPRLARAADQLSGPALIRIGMGLLKRGMPVWVARLVPDAPSIATRFSSAPTPDMISCRRREDGDLDLLCTAGGDRLWKLVLNLALGGRMYGLQRFDYFRNIYYAEVPYRVDGGSLDIWLRLAPDLTSSDGKVSPTDPATREADLTAAIGKRAVIRLEAQTVGQGNEFVPIAEIRFDAEIQIDQEALHFDPVAGRGFQPHGFLTDIRRSVYPASVDKRPRNQPERQVRDRESIFRRLLRF
jgi:hypothetical protein